MSESTADDSVEELPGALPLDSGRPRLIGCGPGRLPIGAYNYSQVRSGTNWVVVEPNAAVYRGTKWFLVGLAVLYPPAIEYVVWHFIRPGDDRSLAAILMPLPSIALLAGAAFAHWMGRSAAAKGPIFRYSGDDQTFHLFWIGRTVPRSQVVRLDLVSGAWIRTENSEAYTAQGGTELHLVVRLKPGRLVSVPLIGTQGIVRSLKRGLGQAARVLSEISGVPLERVEESTQFFDPYPKIRRLQEAALSASSPPARN